MILEAISLVLCIGPSNSILQGGGFMKPKVTRECFFCLSKYFLLIFLLFFAHTVFASTAEWTVLVYVQANNNLKKFAQRNFADMASIGSSENLNILMQSYFPQVNGTSRYKIEKDKMVLDSHIQINSDGTTSNDLVDAMRWAVTKYPAKKYALILWNHGVGILDPIWGNKSPYQTTQKFYIEPALLDASPRIQIDGLTVNDMYVDTRQTLTCCQADVDLSSAQEIEKILKETEIQAASDAKLETYLIRGILFNEQSRNYMTNQALTSALQEIKTSILKNNKIDVLGMDACLMAMIEVGYQAKNFAHYLIASEEAELAHGWDYAALCGALNSKDCTPAQVAQGVVLAYEMLYKNKIQFYTQSAIDLKCMDDLKKSVDEFVYNIKSCKNIDKTLTEQLIRRARNLCLQFSATNYVDLHSYCSEFLNQIDVFKNNQIISKREFVNLKNSLIKTNKIIEQSVIANVSGKQFANAKGLSIYFPKSHVEQSYLQSDFGKSSAWANFISENIKNY